MFIAHGLGVVYINGKQRYVATFYYGIPIHYSMVYDENEGIMWTSTSEQISPMKQNLFFLDTNEEWPAVQGPGIVYNSAGIELYRGNFSRGLPANLKYIVKDMKAEKISFTDAPEDYISLQKFKNHMYAIAINDESLSFKNILSIKTFLTAMENGLKDPLRGSYPALRFRKIQVEIN